MRAEIPSALPLICPACRERTERGRELHTLSVERVLRQSADGEILEGILRCDHAGCRRRYPILDGIPLLVVDLAGFLRTELPLVVEGNLHPELTALLALAGPDDAPWARLVEHLSTYLDAHWGDRATPPPDGPAEPFGMRELAARLHARAGETVERAVELGCSVGRGLAELARGAQLTVGVDLHFGALRRARRILAGEPLAYARRAAGRHYLPATVAAGELACANVTLLCGDALDPPLAPHAFGRVVALNLLDAVHSPPQLLSVLDGLCAPGGELLLGSPYTWQSGTVGEEHRLGEAEPAVEVARRLSGGEGLEAPYSVEDQADLMWWLRRDARSGHAFSVHYLRARKRS